mmetsp:Transcript_6436/g.14860  ORF Transcript_6436/g.14860 Transcript_6436/m.14860 type:complete len:270 (+) Transcript_6436:178-987(+)|eukprot:CAMPEP_0114558326 /NCGR_PEP_ID=MMETSP0114-20121206/10317_1 /TAXON_ID=31324 /ORGANISM="Goniomonas sp, Strain m" /LENGTH=269 /DNA_ID=CAMNT_0001743699 /DNA_START=153 /DNA_END=962 /DNA_ORIENTATION=-
MATSGVIASVSRDDQRNPSAFIRHGDEERPSGVSRFFSSFCSCFAPASGQQSTIEKDDSYGRSWTSSGQDLLPPKLPAHARQHTLVLDLDETLVHSSFKPVADVDFVVPVEIDGMYHNVYVLKRPGVDEFMKRMGQVFEVVVFTASLGKYANPVLDLLDIHKSVHSRLFREACVNYEGNLVKDLSKLGRDIKSTIIVDNSPTSYMLQPKNAVPIRSWFDDPTDRELDLLQPQLDKIAMVDDVLPALKVLQETMLAQYQAEDSAWNRHNM